MVERIKNYLVYIFSNFSKSTHQMYAKKLHTLRLWQKNCTPSGFYGKKIAPFWAASLSEIAIWCATWTGMQNNCSIIKLYYRVLIIFLIWNSNLQLQKVIEFDRMLKKNDLWLISYLVSPDDVIGTLKWQLTTELRI